MEQTYMKEKKILPLVVSMSLPMVLGMLVNALYNIVDSYFVAKISEQSMTAISLVYPLQLVVTAIAVGHGIGINSVASFFLGSNDKKKADNTASLGIFLSFIHGLLLTFICILVLRPFLKLFTSDPTILEYGITYGMTVFLFSIPNCIYIAFEKIYQAQGKMTTSMIAITLGAVTNIILDPLMIFGIGFPKMGIFGAALATGIGQTASFIFYLFVYFIKGSQLEIHFSKDIFNSDICKRIYNVGIPSMMNLSLSSIMITVLNGILAEFSDMYVLILGIYYKLQTFIYLTVNGIVQGIRPLIGYNYGAKEYQRVRKIFITALVLAVIIMTIGTGICMLFSNQLIELFTTNTTTISAGSQALRIISCGFVISSISVIVCGVLEGLGNGNGSLFISLLRYIIVIIPIAFILSRFLGAVGVWHAFWITECISTLISIILIKYTMKFPN